MNIQEKLHLFPRTNITLDQLEQLLHDITFSYSEFAQLILYLEEEGILQAVKSTGRNGKNPSLAYKYRINKSLLRQPLHQELERQRLHFHPAIQLDEYFSLPFAEWKKDAIWLAKINDYLLKNGFPQEYVPAPERSFSLVGDEKWISEKGGEKLLERIGLWEKLLIVPVADPFSFSFNPRQISTQKKERHIHLIVENKTPFDRLISEIFYTPFTTLIFGQGYKIIKSIEHFPRQIPLKEVEHVLYYFGDLDWEGIRIWQLLNEKVKREQKVAVMPAVPFYLACLGKESVPIQTKQTQEQEILEQFLFFFPEGTHKQIQEMLARNYYLPQEVLCSQELREIWREAGWISS